MEPKGKVKQLIDAMQAQPEKLVWAAQEAADVMGVQVGGMAARLNAALRNGWLHQHHDPESPRRALYSLQPQDGDDEPEQFRCALWSDGDLVVYGLQENEDGSVTINPEQLAQIKRLITWTAP